MRPAARLFPAPAQSPATWSRMDFPANGRAHQVRRILSSRGLTLSRVSELSAEIFGRSSLFYTPHNLSFDAQDPASIPTFHQILAISHITNYRLSDWFRVFGFDLDLIPRLRLLVPRKRTTLLDSRVYDSQAWIPWFADRARSVPPPPIAQLVMLAQDRIVLHSPELPCTQIELTLGREARILGRIDAEIRPVAGHAIGRVVTERAVLAKPSYLGPPHRKVALRDLLQSSRSRAGLSFREASSMSRWIARSLADESYFAATSTLSDYETLSAPPRHIQKAITLCVIYAIDFVQFLVASGLPLDREGHDPMPDELVPREAPDRENPRSLEAERQTFAEPSGFLDSLLKRWGEVPLFLRHSHDELTGLKSVSLSDLFWVGGDEARIHPC